MAHFAKIGIDNIVTKVVCFDDAACNTGAEGDCTYAADFQDCDGNCLEDADGDGMGDHCDDDDDNDGLSDDVDLCPQWRDPSNLDTDGDGLFDGEEYWGWCIGQTSFDDKPKI